jgi:hypothetical protein
MGAADRQLAVGSTVSVGGLDPPALPRSAVARGCDLGELRLTRPTQPQLQHDRALGQALTMPATHDDRKLSWSGVLFGLLDWNGSYLSVHIYDRGDLISVFGGNLAAVSTGDDESVALDLIDADESYIGSVVLDFQHFICGHWLGGSLVVQTATTTVWIQAR